MAKKTEKKERKPRVSKYGFSTLKVNGHFDVKEPNPTVSDKQFLARVRVNASISKRKPENKDKKFKVTLVKRGLVRVVRVAK